MTQTPSKGDKQTLKQRPYPNVPSHGMGVQETVPGYMTGSRDTGVVIAGIVIKLQV